VFVHNCVSQVFQIWNVVVLYKGNGAFSHVMRQQTKCQYVVCNIKAFYVFGSFDNAKCTSPNFVAARIVSNLASFIIKIAKPNKLDNGSSQPLNTVLFGNLDNSSQPLNLDFCGNLEMSRMLTTLKSWIALDTWRSSKGTEVGNAVA